MSGGDPPTDGDGLSLDDVLDLMCQPPTPPVPVRPAPTRPDAPDLGLVLLLVVVGSVGLACLFGAGAGVVFLYQLVRRFWGP